MKSNFLESLIDPNLEPAMPETPEEVVEDTQQMKAANCVLAMTQGDKPSRAEFLAAWKHGLIDVTPKGYTVAEKSMASGEEG